VAPTAPRDQTPQDHTPPDQPAPGVAFAAHPTAPASQITAGATSLAARTATEQSIQRLPATDSAAPPAGRRARIELIADNVDVTLGEPVARVVVRRSRWLRGDASFSWWTESGTAKPGRDFIPVTAHTETLGSGKSTATLFIPLLADAKRHDPRSFYVVIDTAGEDAAVGPRTLTQVTLAGLD
jgi:hypothetical protein